MRSRDGRWSSDPGSLRSRWARQMSEPTSPVRDSSLFFRTIRPRGYGPYEPRSPARGNVIPLAARRYHGLPCRLRQSGSAHRHTAVAERLPQTLGDVLYALRRCIERSRNCRVRRLHAVGRIDIWHCELPQAPAPCAAIAPSPLSARRQGGDRRHHGKARIADLAEPRTQTRDALVEDPSARRTRRSSSPSSQAIRNWRPLMVTLTCASVRPLLLRNRGCEHRANSGDGGVKPLRDFAIDLLKAAGARSRGIEASLASRERSLPCACSWSARVCSSRSTVRLR